MLVACATNRWSEVLNSTSPYDKVLPCLKTLARTFTGPAARETGRTKLVPRPKIALDVRGKLFGPEVLVGAGCRTPMAATVAMPEAAVDQDHNPMSRQHHIGATRQVARVKAKAEAGPV